MRNLIACVSGGLFGAGLLLSGTTDTTIIHGWLDVLGPWSPTLGFMFIGSALMMTFAWTLTRHWRHSVLGIAMPARAKPQLDRNLIVGSLLFGTGWGLSGICPGPSMAALTFGGVSGAVFFVAMVVGMLIAVPVRSWLNAPLLASSTPLHLVKSE